MVFRPGFFARLYFSASDWELFFDDDYVFVKTANGANQRLPLQSFNDVIIINGMIWTKTILDVEKYGQVVLPGLLSVLAESLRVEIQRRFSRCRLADLDGECVDTALNDFYTCNRYLAARDVELWRKSLAPEFSQILENFYRLRRHPLFMESDMDSESSKWAKRMYDLLSGERKELKARNEKYVMAEMTKHKDFFDEVEKTPLTDEQRRAAIVMEDRNLLVAAAGSGKTSAVVGKIGYVLKKEICQPEEIVALAFNKAAAEELQERIRLRLGGLLGKKNIKATTFHALGLGFIGEATGKKPNIAEWAAEFGVNLGGKTDDFMEELAQSSEDFLRYLAQLHSYFRWAMKPCHFFQSRASYDKYLESLNIKELEKDGVKTIKGERVRSLEECAIANYLYVNGVEYEYERRYEHDMADEEHGQYTPDFYYPQANLYHEHYALDKYERAPEFMGGDKYVESVKWKRELHKKKGTVCIETTSAMFENGDVFKYLRESLDKHGVLKNAKPPPYRYILKQLCEQHTKDIYALMKSFLSHWKSGDWEKDVLRERLEKEFSGFARARAAIFLEAMFLLREFYDAKLQDNNEVDFDDMLNNATRALHSGEIKNPYKLILADEFQDISRARARMIQAMLKQNMESKLFAVGDDWQAIYRFAGADIFIMTSFREEFGETAQNVLSQTFRSNQGIADIASQFVSRNQSQIKKDVIASDSFCVGVVNVLRYQYDEHVRPLIESKLREVAGFANAREPISVFILGRYNIKFYDRLLPNKIIYQWEKDFTGKLKIKYKTMHGAKGLEADYVFVLGMNAGKFGFPNELEDDPDIALGHAPKRKF